MNIFEEKTDSELLSYFSDYQKLCSLDKYCRDRPFCFPRHLFISSHLNHPFEIRAFKIRTAVSIVYILIDLMQFRVLSQIIVQ